MRSPLGRALQPLGLLTRAWLRSLTGPRTGPESAKSDLDEAWEIAERGPMPLFLADPSLSRAALPPRQTLPLAIPPARPRRSPSPHRQTRLPAPEGRTRRRRRVHPWWPKLAASYFSDARNSSTPRPASRMSFRRVPGASSRWSGIERETMLPALVRIMPALLLEGTQGVPTGNHWQVRQPRPRPPPSEP